MRKYPVLFLISFSVYLLHFLLTRHGIYGDGNGYFSIAHTLFFQGKLDFAPIYRHLSAFQGSDYIFSRVFWDTLPTVTGILNSPWLIGTALFWLPSFLAIFLVSSVFYPALSVFHPLYEFGCGVSGIILVLAGLFLLEKYLRSNFNPTVASLTVLSVYFASQLFYYGSFEPALSHQATFFLVSLYLYLMDRESKSILYPLAYGFIAGLIFITRMGDLFLLIPFIYIQIYAALKHKRVMYLAGLLAFIAAILPQLLFQNALYGSMLRNPYLQGEKGAFHLLSPLSLWSHLFDSKSGFFFYSPLLLASGWGLFKSKKVLLLSAFILYTLFISSWERLAPEGFGNRFFVSAIPVLAAGLAYMIKTQRKRMLILVTSALLWNAVLLTRLYFFQP